MNNNIIYIYNIHIYIYVYAKVSHESVREMTDSASRVKRVSFQVLDLAREVPGVP